MKQKALEQVKRDLRYLRLLQRDFPTISSVTSEIINLEAIMHLPKPTEHFLADLHGEHEAFQHVMRTSSGNIRRKVEEHFGDSLTAEEINDLCTLIYYPEEKLKLAKESMRRNERNAYYRCMLERLIPICRSVSHKYTRSKVRKALPQEYAYIIEELLHESVGDTDKQAYFRMIVDTIIDTHRSRHFIQQLCLLIQRLSVDRLHMLGDVFDRGPSAHLILDSLASYSNLDIAWGNHDVLWMGAAAGNPVNVACVLRISLRYANVETLEDGYGIIMRQLATFAMQQYADDPCDIYMPILTTDDYVSSDEQRVIARMHKAVTIIQWKLESQLYHRHPEWQMTDRCLLECIDFEKGTVNLEGNTYPLRDTHFPTINPSDPTALTAEEESLIRALCHSFRRSDRLQRHMELLLHKGRMYNISNGNLLFHAIIPIHPDGTPREVECLGVKVAGRALMERIDQVLRQPFDEASSLELDEPSDARDYYWYMWCGPDSPLFGKSKMATFERYLIEEKSTHEEKSGNYYLYRDNAQVCDKILDAFGVKGRHRHIINGHVPVRAGKGENPIKAGGRLMVIDGGFAKAYHSKTGIAGYTLVYHSRGFDLVQHAPFRGREEAVRTGADIQGTTHLVEMTGRREMVADTDKGQQIRTQISDLKNLLTAYRHGLL